MLDLAGYVRRRAGAPAADALVERAVEIEPKHDGARCALAGLRLERGNVEAADAIYDAVLADDSANAAAWIGKGQVARARGNRQFARSAFERAAAGADEPTGALLELIEEALATNEIDEARAIASRLLAKNPNNIPALSKLARVETLAGRYDRADAILSDIIERDPAAAAAYVERARVAHLGGKSSRAVRLLAEVLARWPDCVEAFERLAELAAAAGDWSATLGLYWRALELAPWRSDLAAPIARVFLKLGRFNEAASLIEARLVRDGPRAEFYSALAETYDAVGLTPLAKRILAEGRALMPDHFSLWRHEQLRRIEGGEFETVRNALAARKAVGEGETQELSWLAAKLAAAEWDIDSALGFVTRSISRAVGDSWKHEFAARMALLSNDFALAGEHMSAHLRLHRAHNGAAIVNGNVSQTFVGHLIAEMALKPDGAQTIRHVVRATPDLAIQQFLAAIRHDPDYTPTAIALFVYLARYRQAPAPTRDERTERSQPIPRRINQFWNDEEPPDDVAGYCATWRTANPSFEYQRYSLAGARAWLAAQGDAAWILTFDRAREPAMKADLFRLALLYVEGGYYADADDRCRSSLDILSEGGHDLILYQEEIGSLGNNFIAAAPRHPAVALALEGAVAAVLRGDLETIWLSTGPGLITRAVAHWLACADDATAALGRIRNPRSS